MPYPELSHLLTWTILLYFECIQILLIRRVCKVTNPQFALKLFYFWKESFKHQITSLCNDPIPKRMILYFVMGLWSLYPSNMNIKLLSFMFFCTNETKIPSPYDHWIRKYAELLWHNIYYIAYMDALQVVYEEKLTYSVFAQSKSGYYEKLCLLYSKFMRS